ncbi:MAG: S-methyl-5-thioribose-1-phosphate isomerase [Candidatus Kapaibacterium sp.]
MIQENIARTIWMAEDDPRCMMVIDQRRLPFQLSTRELRTGDDAIDAISDMTVRGAPLIGVTAAYGLYLATLDAPRDIRFDSHIADAALRLKRARPTAVNLAWAVDRVMAAIAAVGSVEEKIAAALALARLIEREDVEGCRRIGEHGLPLIEELARRKEGARVNLLTHCNAGWLACVEHGTATAPIYAAFDRGIDLHVWVDETRPRNQGARLTAWELARRGVPHTVIPDNTGGHLMQHGMVDMVIVGCDRATATGDVCNKIGTYLKALAARDNGIPFHVALPASTFDWNIRDGVAEIEIEERGGDEVRFMEGLAAAVMVVPEETPVANYGFDVTPARLVTGLITDRGLCRADEADILRLFPETPRR